MLLYGLPIIRSTVTVVFSRCRLFSPVGPGGKGGSSVQEHSTAYGAFFYINGDIDGNDATERDPSWLPFIDTPMHPEYPCAHCIVSATVGTVLHAEIGADPMPTLTTTSDTAKGAARSWTKIDDFMQEVANARIYDGVHYRNSTEVGTTMGKQIGELAVVKYLRPRN